MAAADISTGELRLSEWPAGDFQEVADELSRLQPAECICGVKELAERFPYLKSKGTLIEVLEYSGGEDQLKIIFDRQWGGEAGINWPCSVIGRQPWPGH